MQAKAAANASLEEMIIELKGQLANSRAETQVGTAILVSSRSEPSVGDHFSCSAV